MTNSIKSLTFNHIPIRLINVNQSIYVIASDVANALGFNYPQLVINALRLHVDDQFKQIVSLDQPDDYCQSIDGFTNMYNTIAISPAGVKNFTTNINNQEAIAFQQWFNTTVTPIINQNK